MLFAVKVCGITCEEDAEKVAEAGADYMGIILNYPSSPRMITLRKAKNIRSMATLPLVVLTPEMPEREIMELVEVLEPYALQFIGDEPPDFIYKLKRVISCEVWKSIHFPEKGWQEIPLNENLKKINLYLDAGVEALVLDTFDRSGKRGGTGKTFDWEIGKRLIQEIKGRVFLAGGITLSNVKEALERVRPYGIDLSSGVESSPGRKDKEKLQALMKKVRELREKYGSRSNSQ